jgi:hypothetical protein
MRLHPAEQDAVREACLATLPSGSRVCLFGSRLDDTVRGGDIDLLVELPRPLPAEEIVERRTRWSQPLASTASNWPAPDRLSNAIVNGQDGPEQPELRWATLKAVVLAAEDMLRTYTHWRARLPLQPAA